MSVVVFQMMSVRLAGLVPVAEASRVIPEDWQVCTGVDWVVVGVVTGRESRWAEFEFGKEVVSDVDFAVELVLNGSPPESFRFTGIGGEIDGVKHRWSGGQSYAVGDRLLLLVAEASSGPEFIPGLVVLWQESVRADLETVESMSLDLLWSERCDPYTELESTECPQEPLPPECSPNGGSGGVVSEILRGVQIPGPSETASTSVIGRSCGG